MSMTMQKYKRKKFVLNEELDDGDLDPKIPPKKKRYGVLFFRAIPRDLKDLFKAYCAKRGTTMQDEIAAHMQECVLNDEKIRIESDTTRYQKIKKMEKNMKTKSQVVLERERQIAIEEEYEKEQQKRRLRLKFGK